MHSVYAISKHAVLFPNHFSPLHSPFSYSKIPPICCRPVQIIGSIWEVRQTQGNPAKVPFEMLTTKGRIRDFCDDALYKSTFTITIKGVFDSQIFIYLSKINDRRTRGPLILSKVHKNTQIDSIRKRTKEARLFCTPPRYTTYESMGSFVTVLEMRHPERSALRYATPLKATTTNGVHRL